MKYFAVLLLTGVLAVGLAAPCGETICPKLLDPMCAQDAEGTWTLFDNECQLNSCGGASAFSTSCHNNHAATVEDCACPLELFI